MENPTQTNERKMVWLDADVALRAYEDAITHKEYQQDSKTGWIARMNLINELIAREMDGKRERREARLARAASRKASHEEEQEMGA